MRRRKRGRKKSKYGALAFLSMLPVLGSLPGPIVMGYTVYSNVATKTYVDEKVDEAFKKAVEHSDNNRQRMLLETNATLNQLQTHDAVIDTEIKSIRQQVLFNSQWIENKQTPRSR